jgi:hypothetical protein
MKLTAILISVIVVLAVALFWGLSARSNVYLDGRCFANVSYGDSTQGNFGFKGNITFEFAKDKTGQFYLTGIVNYQNQNYILSRNVTFNYKNIIDNKYLVEVVGHGKKIRDNMPEDVSALAEKNFGLGGEYFIYLKNNNDNYITIGTPLSPMINCVIQP